ncbi:Uncharacterized conserved protein YlxW, UPF0749 family [Propionispira arboris]|uniref:Uncharacterized conserved protein YlxW, UPF0749 family n=1 Tax=Propionispira arboris TaxID=84035 RepID=A0A1H7AE32_9FIRM|nr:MULTISPECIES: DUF881 domain-containing protein [Propionispira]SEJ63903.1 Uncharacterized conserved protein YlxW, UPF0749 family [Propionispira arboris]
MLSIRQGQVSIALVCMVLGFMLAVQFRTTQDSKSSVSYQRVEELSQRLLQTEKERDGLLDEVNRLKTTSGQEAQSQELADLKMGAGVVPVEGQGITITIDDSKTKSKAGENPNLYLIHDDDLLKVINELKAAGAEAISINEQRLIATSEIRCAGPTLSVNNIRSAPPYEIKAIGDAKNLENALKMRGGVVETLQVWGIQINVKPDANVHVPAYKSTFHFQFMKAAAEDGEKQ